MTTKTKTDRSNTLALDFHPDRRVEITFDAPNTSSDGGVVLLRNLDENLGFCAMLAKLLPDARDPGRVSHPRLEQLRQRVFQIALGYEDQNDGTSLRNDPLWKTACDRLPDDAMGLSSQPTLSRFEHSVDARTVVKLQRTFEDDYVASLPAETEFVVLDIDGTEDPTHGQQPMSFFNAHYDSNMYYPFLVFDGDGRLASYRLRPGNAGNNKYSTALVVRLVRKVKRRFPDAMVLVRADGGFCTPRMLDAIEQLHRTFGHVSYAIGLPKNPCLLRPVAEHMLRVELESQASRHSERFYTTIPYRAKSWSRERLIVAKLEHLVDKANPRFVATNIDHVDPQTIYERIYCARGDAENRIKDFKRALAGDRLSNTTYVANAMRMSLHAFAFRLIDALRRQVAAVSPQLGRAQFDTLRLRLLKVATLVTQSARRIHLRLPRAFPFAEVFSRLLGRLALRPQPTETTAPYAA